MLQLILGIIVSLVVLGVVMWAINRYLSGIMQPDILRLLNIAVVVIAVVCVILWILGAFGLLPLAGGPPVPRLR